MEDESWILDIQKKVEVVNPSEESNIWKKQSIYRVPQCVSLLNPKAYQPQVVSFGPYHHEEEKLKPMEEHKNRALLHFLKRGQKTIGDYLKALEEVSQQLMDAYERLDPKWCDLNKFLKMMLLDGVFMVEILRTANSAPNTYTDNDPIFSSHGTLHMVPYISRDMMMIENQLPLLLLQTLLKVENEKNLKEEFLNKMVLKFFAQKTHIPKLGQCLHVLDIVRKSMLLLHPPHPSKKSRPPRHPYVQKYVDGSEIVRSAMELNEAGIWFKTSPTLSLMDITFRDGTLYLPTIIVDDTTESTLLNLMAFERLHVGAGNQVTSYVFFMDNIIDSNKDVSLLSSKGIIKNALGSDKAVARLFNELSKDVTLDPNSTLNDIHRDVNLYCAQKWNEYRAILMHTYFRSPWAVLSLLAALVLLILTVLQTVYTVYPYYKPK